MTVRRRRFLAPSIASLALGACLATGLSSFDSRAAPAAPRAAENLDVTADRLELDVEAGALQLDGNVRVRLAELEIECAHVRARYDEKRTVRSVRGTGGVRARYKGVDVSADLLELAVGQQALQLTGNVRVTQGVSVVRAESASLDLKTRKLVLKRVSGSIPLDGFSK